MNTTHTTASVPVFELKGSVLTVLVLHIRQADADRLYPQLEKKIGQARAFFNSAPLLIDLGAMDEEEQAALDLRFLADTLRRMGLVPVGVRGGGASLGERVLQAGLGVLPSVKTEKTVTCPEERSAGDESARQQRNPESSQPAPARAAAAASTRVVPQPVRSGQQVIAPEGDLVILSSVNPGAEVLAAGNIHVYGALRGRAMAGINGDVNARIFSLQCNAELLAVAGEYMVNESLDEGLINRSVMVSLKDGALDVQAIGSFSPLS